jgi:hypothetical protein
MNKELFERVLKRLNDKLIVDKEYMEADDVKALHEEIDGIKNFIEAFSDVELIGHYCPNYDKTFVTRCEYFNGELFRETCVGWYYGEPTEDNNKTFSDKLTATYNF